MRKNLTVVLALAAIGMIPTAALRGRAADDARKLPTVETDGADETGSYRMVGDQTSVNGMLPVKVEGLGLVVGLRGTGSNPPPNRYRETVLTTMKQRQIPDAEEILASNSTAIVLLRAYVTAGARKGDPVDVEVWVPPGDAATSLRGGRLLEAELHANMMGNGRPLQGDTAARVSGPVVVWQTASDKTDTTELRKGRVLGGGRILADRDFRIVLDKSHRSGRTSKRLAERINQRFFRFDRGRIVGLANAKDDKVIELGLDDRYRHNVQRYLLVVRRIPIETSEFARQRLLQRLNSQLQNPATAMEAALCLEAIGKPAVDVLKEGLQSRSELCRFCSAEALAYLGDSSSTNELARAAVESPIYRSYSLAALVAMDQTHSRLKLEELIHAAGAETRYGAFRALFAYDERDPAIRGEPVPMPERPTEAASSVKQPKAPPKPEFYLHVVESPADPMVHLSRNFRPEVVLFNGRQQLLTPLSLRAGETIMVIATEDAENVQLVAFEPGPDGVRERRELATLQLADVIRKAGALGATYSDVAELLRQASEQGNLAGRLEVNALPRSYRLDALHEFAAQERGGRQLRTDDNTLSGLFSVTGHDGKSTAPLLEVNSERGEEPKAPADEKRTRRGLFRWFSN